MEIVGRGTIFQPKAGTDMSLASHTSICALPSGKLIATFRAGSTKDSADGNVYMATSTDKGKTWSEPVAHFDSTSDGVPGSLRGAGVTSVADDRLLALTLWVDRTDPSSPFFNPETEGLLPVKNLLYESRDEGESWSYLRPLDTSVFGGQPTKTGPILRVSKDVLAAQLELNKDYEDARPWMARAVMMFSYDGGTTWPEHSTVANDPAGKVYYWDQRPTVLGENRLLNLFWTFDRNVKKDITIHRSRSDDGGRTWTKPADTGIEGQIAFPTPLQDGRVFMAYVDRYGERTIRARLSDDEGETWSAAPELILWPGEGERAELQDRSERMGDYLQDMELWSFGLPSCATLPDGDLFVVYYAGGEGVTGVHWVRVKA